MKYILSVVALSVSLISTSALAQDSHITGEPHIQEVSTVTEKNIKLEQRGMEVIRDIQYSRLSLFSGDTSTASKLIKKANDLLGSEYKTWESIIRKDKKAPQKDDVYVIINSQLTLAEDFTATPEKQKAIDEANKKLDKGDKKGAIEKLQLAGINISETQWLMPLKQTQQKVRSAQILMAEGKYYEANLALKGAEDGIIMDTVSFH
ncbi:YfdX family protein [Escherichia coli]|uniref:YfdX family protein n=1 Tax=Escherichia coli TaxID=562 RepID=A0A8S7IBB0_ECOLX|nr:YfdX family protein [Escherichia coli]EES0915696.1 YfdX family protein [Escherichia coli]EFC2249259.1 YfdX family protein [Escherichia coli]EFD0877240.1 YfdX family protein [Escherichia coli]EFD0881640.1 YfdX family protein [Escherichia coli]EFK8697503.1 YfdX family protein [Escherichia coli]